MFSGQKMVVYCFMSSFGVATSFRHRDLNFLYFSCPWCSITYVVALSLSRSYIIVTCPAPILRPHFNAVSARVPCNWIHNFLSAITTSVVEPFHFGQAPPAPASQDGGSSSSPVVHNLLLKKKLRKTSLLDLPGLFNSQKCTSALLCSSGTLLKGTD